MAEVQAEERAPQAGQVERWDSRRGQRRDLERLGDGALAPEVVRQLSDVARGQAERERAADNFARSRIAPRILEEGPPALPEPPLGGDFVLDSEARVDPMLGGERAENVQGEGVDRRDLGPLQSREGGEEGRSFPHARGQAPLHLAADAVTQLGCGLLRESDGDKLLDAPPREHQGHVAVDERQCLACAGASLDEQCLVQQLADEAARRLVVAAVALRLGGHVPASPRAVSATRRQGRSASSSHLA